MMIVLVVCVYAIVAVQAITLKKECPEDEVHKSCAFYEEYCCWQEPDRQERVRLPPKRLPHCRSGCYCKKGLVREFIGGKCIPAVNCLNKRLRGVLIKMGLY
ncbi:hypothetical protein ABMA28_005434 [Loxostege sticticalis]|uniref:TIL domain-containing protein n=1 Tax=Loxostege sticticalis TaxID=481309 RepID=A0ABD0SQE9_LOXSC